MIKRVKEKNILLAAYKLSYDVLFLVLLTFAMMLVGEAILPGFISAKISFTKITILLVAVIAVIGYLGQRLNISHPSLPIQKNRLLPFWIIFSFLLIGNSMLKFALWENLTITLLTLALFFLFYKLIFSSRK